ncbi:MAG: hypothetical protein KC493_00015 [Bacteriovoracaceae bacterium]|nr:hypothetical protein [Bacteriovoracaceae bacterium]
MKKLMLIMVAMMMAGSVFADLNQEFEKRNDAISTMKSVVRMTVKNILADNGMGKVVEDESAISVQSETSARGKIIVKDHRDTICKGDINVDLVDGVEEVTGRIKCVLTDGESVIVLDK